MTRNKQKQKAQRRAGAAICPSPPHASQMLSLSSMCRPRDSDACIPIQPLTPLALAVGRARARWTGRNRMSGLRKRPGRAPVAVPARAPGPTSNVMCYMLIVCKSHVKFGRESSSRTNKLVKDSYGETCLFELKIVCKAK